MDPHQKSQDDVERSQGWPTRRLRFLVRRITSDDRTPPVGFDEATFVAMDAIGTHGSLDLSVSRRIDDVRSGYTQLANGDVVVAEITPCFENGKGALIRGMAGGIGFGTTELHVLKPGPDLDGRYLYYVTVDPRFRKLGEAWMFGAAGQQRVPEDFVRDYRIAVPPLSQQRAIADYLDRETARLDALVAEHRRLLDLLDEKRVTLITSAVIRGLDRTVPFGDSGVSWIGEIPAHWELWKLGHVALIGNGSTPNRGRREYWEDGDVPWLNSSVVNRGRVTGAEQFVTRRAVRECHLPIVKRGAVLVAITGQGKTRGRADRRGGVRDGDRSAPAGERLRVGSR